MPTTPLPVDHRLSQAILDTLTSHVAVVDANGVIVAVNKAWTRFAVANGNPGLASTSVGTNYLDVARLARGPYAEEGQAIYLALYPLSASRNHVRTSFQLVQIRQVENLPPHRER